MKNNKSKGIGKYARLVPENIGAKIRGIRNMKINKDTVKIFFKKLPKILEWVVIITLVTTALLLVLSKINTPLNFKVFSVQSGSMEPAIKTGSVVFVKPEQSYEIGDVITYQARGNPNNSFTHRVVDVQKDEDIGKVAYVTKGDANEDPDTTPVVSSRVLGRVFFKIPLLGYLVSFAKTQLGFTLLVVIPATVIIYSEVQNIRKEITGAETV